MINAVYQLVSPRMIDVTYKEVDLAAGEVVMRPYKLSICKADQRYYQGMRSQAALKAKLPMALVHECVAQVVYDPTGTFEVGDFVVPIPTVPTETDEVIAENYLRSSYFRSSGNDGFLQDIITATPDRVVKLPPKMNMNVASFSELVSVSVHAIRRFDKIAHSRRKKIGIWGDGNVGYITALIFHYLYPETDLYIFGTVEEKLSYFSFAKATYHVDHVPEGVVVDHGFECVGGAGSRSAINQMIDLINPEGTMSLMGVSENFVDINTRMVLEKGLRLYGSSRSGREDFVQTVELYKKFPKLVSYLDNLVGDVIRVETIGDIHSAFDKDIHRSFGKTVIDWAK